MGIRWIEIAAVIALAAGIVVRIRRRPRADAGGPTIFWYGLVPVEDSRPPRTLESEPSAETGRFRLFLDSGNVCLTFGAWLVYANYVTLALWLAIAVGVVVWLSWV